MKELSTTTLLVASPHLMCPFFRRSVVLLIEHGEEGSFGFVLNKRSPVEFDDVISELQIQPRDRTQKVPVLMGGPVCPDAGWVVFELAQHKELPVDTVQVGATLGISASMTMLEHVLLHTPKQSCLALGYAGWGAGQLEDELKQGSWIPVDLGPEAVLQLPLEDRWRAAIQSLGFEPAMFAGTVVAQA